MTSPATQDVTGLLQAWSRGDQGAAEKLVPLIYDEMRRQAARHLRRERPGHTLRPTAVVHEAYMRLVDQRQAVWKNRTQFFAVAAQTMRRVLVDHARRRQRAKRAGGWCRVTLEEGLAAYGPRDLDVVALGDALDELSALDATKARMVDLRFFAGLSVEDTAEALGVSEATVTREWRVVRAWLYRRLSGNAAPAPR